MLSLGLFCWLQAHVSKHRYVSMPVSISLEQCSAPARPHTGPLTSVLTDSHPSLLVDWLITHLLVSLQLRKLLGTALCCDFPAKLISALSTSIIYLHLALTVCQLSQYRKHNIFIYCIFWLHGAPTVSHQKPRSAVLYEISDFAHQYNSLLT